MTIQPATFPMGGVHPRENKDLTNGLPIEKMPDPAQVSLFLKQHVGAPCEISVPPRPDEPVDDGILFATGQPGAVFRLLVKKRTG